MRILTWFSVAFLAYGLWVHDWTTIVMAGALAAIWPLIRQDIYERSRQREADRMLERLWADDDEHLSNSA